MSNPEHFRNRAIEYRRLAQISTDEKRSETFFEIAHMFNFMADDLTRMKQDVGSPIIGVAQPSYSRRYLAPSHQRFWRALINHLHVGKKGEFSSGADRKIETSWTSHPNWSGFCYDLRCRFALNGEAKSKTGAIPRNILSAN